MSAQIFARIMGERERQDKKFGEKNTGRPLSRYGMIITEEFGEAAQALNDLLEEVDTWDVKQDGTLTEEQYQTMHAHFTQIETEMIEAAACILLLLQNMRNGTYQLS